MKYKLNEYSIYLTPENSQDKMYIYYFFLKALKGTGAPNLEIDATQYGSLGSSKENKKDALKILEKEDFEVDSIDSMSVGYWETVL